MLAKSGTAAPGTSPPSARKPYSQSSPIFIALTPLSMEDEAAIAVSFQSCKPLERGKVAHCHTGNGKLMGASGL